VFNYSASAYAGAGLRSRPSRSVPCSRQCHYLPLTSRCSTRPMAAGRPFHCGFASIARAPLSFALQGIAKQVMRREAVVEHIELNPLGEFRMGCDAYGMTIKTNFGEIETFRDVPVMIGQ